MPITGAKFQHRPNRALILTKNANTILVLESSQMNSNIRIPKYDHKQRPTSVGQITLDAYPKKIHTIIPAGRYKR